MNDDLISRAEAIEEIVSLWNSISGLHPHLDDTMALYADIKRIIKQLPSAQQWIPCSERLPKHDEIVLVWYCDETRIGYLTDISETDFSWDGIWVLQGSFPIKHDSEKIVAWMPLPDPYEGVKDETD